MLPSKVSPVDRQGLQVRDRVQVLTNVVRMPERTVGTIVGFSTGSDHPIVEIPGRGRFLIPALSLRRIATEREHVSSPRRASPPANHEGPERQH